MLDKETLVWQVLGSFWEKAWLQPSIPGSMVRSWSTAFEEWNTASASLSNDAALPLVRLFDQRHWTEFFFLDADVSQRLVRVGEFTIGLAHTIGAKQKKPALWGIPDGGYDVAAISTTPVNGGSLLWRGQDFEQSGGRLWFFKNPATMGFNTTVVPDETGAPAMRRSVWLCLARKANDRLTGNFGPPVRARVPSDETGRRVMLALWRAAVDGGTEGSISSLLAAATDSDTQPADGTVTAVWGESDRTWVAAGTLASARGSTVVSVGDVLESGSLLTDSVQYLRGTIQFSDLPAMRLAAGLLAPGVPGGVVLENQVIDLAWEWMSADPLVSVEVVDGLIYIIGPNGASAGIADESILWEYGVAKVPVFECGVDEDAALAWRRAMAAGILETGVDLFGAMSAESAPPHSFNPFKFFKDNFFGQNFLFAKLDQTCLIAPGLVNLCVRAAAESLSAGAALMLLWKVEGAESGEAADTACPGLLLAEGSDTCAVSERGLVGAEYLF